MKKIGIFFGSSTGTCEDIAGQIGGKLGVDNSDIMSASQLTAELVNKYEVLLLGTSTWGDGEIQDDWYDGIKVLEETGLSGKLVGIFGCGDSDSYADTYCDGMGILFDDLSGTGCTFIGDNVSTDGYEFEQSTAVRDGHFIGLALDDVNQDDMTEERIDVWLSSIAQDIE